MGPSPGGPCTHCGAALSSRPLAAGERTAGRSDACRPPTQPIPVRPLASQGLRRGLGAGAVLRVAGSEPAHSPSKRESQVVLLLLGCPALTLWFQRPRGSSAASHFTPQAASRSIKISAQIKGAQRAVHAKFSPFDVFLSLTGLEDSIKSLHAAVSRFLIFALQPVAWLK